MSRGAQNTVKMNFTIQSALLKRVEEYRAEKFLTRSELIRQALIMFMDKDKKGK